MADKTPLQQRADEVEAIRTALDGSMLHQELARGYESVGHWDGEQRELTRGIFLQNQAIILLLIQIKERTGS